MLRSKCHDAAVLLEPFSDGVEGGPHSFRDTNSWVQQDTPPTPASTPFSNKLGSQLQSSAPLYYGILIAHVFNSPKECLSWKAICARLQKKIAGGDKKIAAWQAAVLLELFQNDNFSPTYARTWQKPFRKQPRWHISQEAWDKYSPYKESKTTSIHSMVSDSEKFIVVQEPPFELDGTPITSRLVSTQSTVMDRKLSQQGSNQENGDINIHWNIEDAQYWPVALPSIHGEKSAAGKEPQYGINSSSSDSVIEYSTRRKVMPYAWRRIHQTEHHPFQQPKALNSKSSPKRQIKRKPLHSEPQSELTWPLSQGNIVISPSSNRSVDMELETSASSIPCPLSTPLLSPADEQKLFSVVPIAKYVPNSCDGKSSDQGDQGGANSQKAGGSSSKVDPNRQRQPVQGSGQRLNGHDTDDDLIDRSRKRRKRFPPGDDPSSNYPSNGCKFACVYHKFHPQQYGVSNRRYLVCEGTGFRYISELIRHIERTHDRIICNRCLDSLSREDRSRHITTCDARLRLSQSEKWHRIWREIFPFASRCPNPYFEPLSRQPISSDLQSINTNHAIAVLNPTSREHSSRLATDGQDTPSLSDRSICERSAGPSVSDESTLIDEDAARQCQCHSHAKGKGKASRTHPSAAADLALPVQINIRLLGGRVESLERQLPFIEETIKMLSNLMSLQGATNSCRDSAMSSVSTTSSAFSKVTVPQFNHDPCPVDPLSGLDATYHKPCATPVKAGHVYVTPIDLEMRSLNGLGVPDFDEELLADGMDLTTNLTTIPTLFNDEALLDSPQWIL